LNAYTKIETVYKRDIDGTKKLIEGDFRSEAVEYLKDNEWIFSEKCDGCNTGIFWDGHKVAYQGRTERAQIPAHLTNKLISIFGTDEAEEMFEQTFGEKQVVLFGEGYGAKIQKGGGNYIPDGCDFILFDVYMPDSDTWLKRDGIEDIAKRFGIKAVPIVMTGTIEQAVEFIKTQPRSLINPLHEMEGVVGKPKVDFYDRSHNRLIVKIKVKDFA
jgi:hypothetical protein